MSLIKGQEGVQWVSETIGQTMITGALLGGVFALALGELAPSFDGDLLDDGTPIEQI